MTYSTTSTANTAPHSNNAALRSESPYQQRTTQRENPAQQLIKQAVEFLLQQLEAGKSETLTAYLAAMARFHKYSFGNILAIARQKPTATHVAGIRAWNELGRFVKKGEKGVDYVGCVQGGAAWQDWDKSVRTLCSGQADCHNRSVLHMCWSEDMPQAVPVLRGDVVLPGIGHRRTNPAMTAIPTGLTRTLPHLKEARTEHEQTRSRIHGAIWTNSQLQIWR